MAHTKAKMSIDYISFSIHFNNQQISEFMRLLKPQHVAVVSDKQIEMSQLKQAMQHVYKEKSRVNNSF